MSIVKLKITIKTNDEQRQEELSGIYHKEEQLLSYIDESHMKTEVSWKKKEIKRENDEMSLFLPFLEGKTTNGNCFLKRIQKNILLEITTHRIITKDNYFLVQYEIEKKEKITCEIELKEA